MASARFFSEDASKHWLRRSSGSQWNPMEKQKLSTDWYALLTTFHWLFHHHSIFTYIGFWWYLKRTSTRSQYTKINIRAQVDLQKSVSPPRPDAEYLDCGIFLSRLIGRCGANKNLNSISYISIISCVGLQELLTVWFLQMIILLILAQSTTFNISIGYPIYHWRRNSR